jgi:hypothetical protein
MHLKSPFFPTIGKNMKGVLVAGQLTGNWMGRQPPVALTKGDDGVVA